MVKLNQNKPKVNLAPPHNNFYWAVARHSLMMMKLTLIGKADQSTDFGWGFISNLSCEINMQY